MPSRHYTDAQLGAIIQRATELHEASGGEEQGLTLHDAERVATELGIPTAHVRAAARELNAPAERKHGLLGAPFSVGVVQSLPTDPDDSHWQRVVLTLKRETGRRGRLGEFGREWSYGLEDGGVVISKTRVSVQQEGDGATLDLRAHYGGIAFSSYLLSLVVGMGMAVIVIDSTGLPDTLGPPALISLTASGGLGGMALVRAGLTLWADRQRERLGRLAGLVQRALSTAEPPAVSVRGPSPTVLDLDGLPDSPEAEVAPSRTRVR